jgi:site-specific DNA recombinase
MPRADASRHRCAIYTRKSSEEGLEQEFNSLAAQREACEAYIRSQQHEGWVLARPHYDDGGFSGGNLARPALQRLLADIRTGRIDIVVVYKVDRLTRSRPRLGRIDGLLPAGHDIVVDPIFDVGRRVRSAKDSVVVRVVFGEKQGRITIAVQHEVAELGMRGFDRDGVLPGSLP